MNEREKLFVKWFDMWLKQQDFGMDKIKVLQKMLFTSRKLVERKYENLKTVKHWFNEWNTHLKSLFGILNSSFIKKIKLS